MCCSGVANCPELGLPMIAALIITSQYMRNVAIPRRLPGIGGCACSLPFPAARSIHLGLIMHKVLPAHSVQLFAARTG